MIRTLRERGTTGQRDKETRDKDTREEEKRRKGDDYFNVQYICNYSLTT